MNLASQRPWITPVVIGAFTLSAVTGVLMFFHLDTALNKAAHEWLSWAMVAGVLLHVLLNLNAFKRYLTQRVARGVLAVFVLLLGLSFVPWGGTAKKEPSFAGPVRALATAPLPVVAQVAGLDTEQLRSKLVAAGYPAGAERQSVQDIVGPDLRTQLKVLRLLMPATAP